MDEQKIKKLKTDRDKIWISRIKKHNLTKRSTRYMLKRLSKHYCHDFWFYTMKSLTSIQKKILNPYYIGWIVRRHTLVREGKLK